MKLLRAEKISLTKERSILKEISLTINSGETIVLLGPSGSGKTSLLRCFNQFETIDSGKIFLNGIEISSIPKDELRRRIGMVFQTSSLIPTTVRENVLIGPKLHNRNMKKDEVDELLEKVGVPFELWEKDVDILSVGERQLVALTQVLANKPEVLLLDEPTSALDPNLVLKVEESIKNIHQNMQMAIILVTHNMDQARRMDTQTLLLGEGKIKVEAPFRKLENILNETGDPVLKSYFNYKGGS